MNLNAQLDHLEIAQLLRPIVAEEPAYIFRHTLMQESAYDSLLKNQRREIHRAVAHAYEEIYADRCLDEFAAILAGHYAEAGDEEHALAYATHAGDVAAHLYANTEAIAFYTQAINIAQQRADNTTQLITLYARRGRAYELAVDYPRAIENYREMQRLAQTRGDRALELESEILQATAYAVGPSGVQDLRKAHEISVHALALAQELDDRNAQARIYWNLLLANRFGEEGRLQAREYGEKSLALARELKMKEQIALTLKDMIGTVNVVGHTDPLLDHLPEMVSLWRELDNKPMLGEALVFLAYRNFVAGDLNQALRAGEESLALHESIGNVFGLSFARAIIWYFYREQGEMTRAIELVDQAITVANEMHIPGPHWGASVDLADTFVYLGDFARAKEYLQRALATADDTPLTRPIHPRAIMARLELQRGNRAVAEKWLAPFPRVPYAEYRKMFVTRAPPIPIAMAFIDLALAQGEAQRGLDLAQDAVASLRELALAIIVPSFLHLQAKALWMLQRVDEAYRLLIDARQQAEAMGTRYRLLPILLTLMEMETERGDTDALNKARSRAREIIEYISEHSPLGLRESFTSLPTVRRVMAE